MSPDPTSDRALTLNFDLQHDPGFRRLCAQGIIDLTIGLGSDTVAGFSATGLGAGLRPMAMLRSKGDLANFSSLKLDLVHTGTHLDAPSHFVQVRA